MARELGDAFFNISPDSAGFRPKLIAQVKAAMAGVNADLPVTVDTRRLDSSIAAVRAKVAALTAKTSSLQLDADTKAATAKIAALQLQQVKLAAAMQNMEADVEIRAAATKILALSAQIKALESSAQNMRVDADTKSLFAKLAAAQAELADLTRQKEILVSADTSGAIAKITALREATAALQQSIASIKIDVNDTAGLAKIATFQAKVNALNEIVGKLTIDADTAPALAKVLALQAEVAGFGKTASDAGTAAFRPWYSLWSLIGRKVTLFGGAFGTTGILASIGAVHLLVDSVVELLAVLIPASIALASFGIAAAPTIEDITKKMQAVVTTSTALGQSIYPLTDSFKSMADAVQPQVYRLFGEGLVVMAHNTGAFVELAKQAGDVLDQLGARAAAALTSGGFAKLLADGPRDLAMFGDIIANIFGTIGNLLKVVPGYAEILLTILDQLTKAMEAVSASPIGQFLLGVGLAFHGFIIWAGLGVTAALALGNALVGLGAKIGLVSAETTLFDASAFVGGLQTMIGGAVLLGKNLVTLAGAEDIAAASSLSFEGAMAALGAISPIGWIAIAVAGLTALAIWLSRGSDASAEFVSNVQKALSTAPISQLGLDITRQQVAALGQLNSLQTRLAGTTAEAAKAYQGLANTGTQNSQALTNSAVSQYRAQTQLNQQISDYKALLPVLATDQANYNAVLKAAGGNLSLVNDAGITSNQILTANASQLKQLEIEALAAAAAQNALALGTGRAAAAQNAQTGDFLTEQLPAMQKVIKAEDDLLQVVTGGQTAFNSFQQSIQGTTAKFVSPSGLADAAKLAKDNLSGMNEQSLAFSNTLYNISIPALQKLIDNLELQGISTKNLTTVVATGANQMLQYVGNNKEAQSVIIALINNALGPGTVSLQNLRKWVDQNSTSMSGFSAIVATSTVKAGALAGVLNDQLVKSFQASLFNASGAQTAINNMTNAIVNGGTQSNAFKSARDQLIADLEKTGLSATASKGYVDNLQKSIDSLHGNTVKVGVVLSASGGIHAVVTAPGVAAVQGGGEMVMQGLATGGWVPGSGNRDTVPAMLTPGEVVVPKGMVQAGAVDHLRGKLPGFATGGLVAGENFVASQGSAFTSSEGTAFAGSMVKAFQAAVAAAAAAVPTVATAGSSGGIIATMMRNMAAARGWTGSQWNALYAVEMAEAGFNMTATNPSSGAYGLAQFINGPSEYYTYGGNPNTAQGQITAMLNYIAQRYGTPAAAWAHEQADHWYNKGGLVSGFAAGGLAGSLAAGQAAERNAFSGVRSAVATALAHPSPWLSTNKKSVTSEMATLTKRQVSEQAAYAALSGKGLTAKNLSKFATQLHGEIATSKDKRINTAVASPMRSLLTALDALNVIATTGKIASTSTSTATKGSTTGSATGSGSVKSAPKGSSGSVGTVKVGSLPPVTIPIGANTSPLTKSEYAADLAAVKGLSLEQIRKSPHLSHIWHLLHLQHLWDIGHNKGGLITGKSYDQGGWIYPGTTLVHNRTGQAERVLPPGSGRKLSADAQAIVDALERNTAAVISQGSAFARGLNSTANAAATRGSYTTRRL